MSTCEGLKEQSVILAYEETHSETECESQQKTGCQCEGNGIEIKALKQEMEQ